MQVRTQVNCPYCHECSTISSTGELLRDRRVIDCERCGQEFVISTNITMSCTARKIEGCSVETAQDKSIDDQLEQAAASIYDGEV